MISAEGLQGIQNAPEETLLDISCISDGQFLDCLAYVQSCNVKMSKIGSPFVTFYLKDKNANMITARLFDASKESLEIAQVFNRRPVHLHAEVQIYGGSYSLIIDESAGISVYNGDFDYSAFIGKYDVDLSTATTIYKSVMGSELPKEMYESLSVDFLGSGKVGAFAKIYDIALSNIMFLEGINGIDVRELTKVFFIVMHQYYLILNHYNTFGPLERLKLIEEYNNVHCDQDYQYVVLDTLRSLCENTKPLHLYSHVIKNAVSKANQTLQLIETNNTLVSGASTQVYFTDMLGNPVSGGVELLKY